MIDLVTEIKLASPEELSKILHNYASEIKKKYYNDDVAIKVNFEKLSNKLMSQLSLYQEMLSYGNLTNEEFYNDRKKIVFSTENVISNINIALEYLRNTANTTVVKEPQIDWKKPIYTISEVEELLGVTRNTLKKYMDNGYLSFSSLGDKKWFTKEDIDTFLSHPDVKVKAFKEAKFSK